MSKYAALLRGINVGERIIKMSELQVCFEKMGLKEVKTYLQSGNVTFESNLSEIELKQKIEAVLTKTFNYPAKVIVVSAEKLKKIVDANPFTNAPADYHQYVIFFENSLEKDFAKEEVKLTDEAIKIGSGVIYWKVQKGMTLKSAIGKLLTKTKYKNFNTNRNINTLKKLIM